MLLCRLEWSYSSENSFDICHQIRMTEYRLQAMITA